MEATGRNIVALTFCAVYSAFHEEVHEVYSDHKQFFCLNDICVVVDFFCLPRNHRHKVSHVYH